MKHLFLLFMGMIFLQIAGMAQDYENAGAYMDVISKQQENISKKFLAYVSASAHGKRERKVENLRSKLLDEVQEAKMNIGSMPAYKGDKAYRDTSVSFIKLYYNVLNEDYSKIINMEDIAEQSYDAMEAYLMAKEMVDKKMEEGNIKMKAAQQEFADKNNIHLTSERSELGDMMKAVHEMNVYYHQVYLVFFRPYKQENYMMEAMEKNNITGIEQNKSSLGKYAQTGLEKLTSLKPFEGDNTIVVACKNMLGFYVMEVNDKMNAVSDFYLTKERFEAIKKEYEKKNDHSQADIDTYNKSVNDINKASESLNATNKMLNERRTNLLNEWNNAVNEFFNEHTPHYN
jgi:hypothetical protein